MWTRERSVGCGRWVRCGARNGASRELGGPGCRACVYPPPSLSLCGCAGSSLAWADQMGRPSGLRTPPKYRFLAPPHCHEQAGFLPFLLPACPPSQALTDRGGPRSPMQTSQDQREIPRSQSPPKGCAWTQTSTDVYSKKMDVL